MMRIHLRALKQINRLICRTVIDQHSGFFNETDHILPGDFAFAAFPRMEVPLHQMLMGFIGLAQ